MVLFYFAILSKVKQDETEEWTVPVPHAKSFKTSVV